ncbi:MAG: ATP-binding cassette domain-containing protein, partial [Dehalococcoidia bacterium]|nr:ATP-binding cassette domain-containing protein [Dehalococcoidia bacterium]
TVGKGEVFGFLGPNGAGKTTTISMLCTLLRPTEGRAWINGYEVNTQQREVRRSIGLTFQDPSLDVQLTGKENMEFHAYIYDVPRQEAKRRMEELLNMVELWDRRNDLVRGYSGGMRRRLELARGLLHHPSVLFLDEPTLGLDPQTRGHIWTYITNLREQEGVTIFLTTHYLDEAEHCDRIAIIDHGLIVALDTPSNLKALVRGDIIDLRSSNEDETARQIEARFGLSVTRENGQLSLEVPNGEEFIPQFVRAMGPEIRSIGLRRPTLDDVFLKLTGRAIREEAGSQKDEMARFARRMRSR